MSIPTSIQLNISGKDSRPFRLSLPPWILLPSVFLLTVLVLPFVLLLDVFALLLFRFFPLTRTLIVLLSMGACLKGLEIDVESKSENVLIVVN